MKKAKKEGNIVWNIETLFVWKHLIHNRSNSSILKFLSNTSLKILVLSEDPAPAF